MGKEKKDKKDGKERRTKRTRGKWTVVARRQDLLAHQRQDLLAHHLRQRGPRKEDPLAHHLRQRDPRKEDPLAHHLHQTGLKVIPTALGHMCSRSGNRKQKRQLKLLIRLRLA